jgi:hypothetical protein
MNTFTKISHPKVSNPNFKPWTMRPPRLRRFFSPQMMWSINLFPLTAIGATPLNGLFAILKNMLLHVWLQLTQIIHYTYGIYFITSRNDFESTLHIQTKSTIVRCSTPSRHVLIPQVRLVHKYPISPWKMIHPPGGDNPVCMLPCTVYTAVCNKSLTAIYQYKIQSSK